MNGHTNTEPTMLTATTIANLFDLPACAASLVADAMDKPRGRMSHGRVTRPSGEAAFTIEINTGIAMLSERGLLDLGPSALFIDREIGSLSSAHLSAAFYAKLEALALALGDARHDGYRAGLRDGRTETISGMLEGDDTMRAAARVLEAAA